MPPHLAPNRSRPTRPDDRPFAFLVSTPRIDPRRAHALGQSAYSYAFVLDALAPVLERLGTWRRVEHPESSLLHAARRAEAEGRRPVHLALCAPQHAYLAPGVPNLIYPFWEFPDLPDRDLGGDPRQDWTRVLGRADLVLSACRFTADAIRRAGVRRPVAVVPVPVPPHYFEVPDWDPAHAWSLTCRHLVWDGGGVGPAPPAGPAAFASPSGGGPSMGPRRPAGRASRAFEALALRLEPWVGPGRVARCYRAKQAVGRMLRALAPGGRSPGSDDGARPLAWRGRAFVGLRRLYRRHVRRWLSDEALDRATAAKVRILGAFGIAPAEVRDPLLPTGVLTLSGLVYTSIFNPGDRRKNEADLLSAFSVAFRDRPDATLVLKLVTRPACEFHDVQALRRTYEGLGLAHRCRVVVVAEYLSDDDLTALVRASTFYATSTRAEGACLPLQHALAAGRPALAPDHSALGDFMDGKVGFVLRSHPEPTFWPHDPDRRVTTTWDRLVWSDLRDLFRESARMVDSDPGRYRRMAAAARRRMADYAARDVAAEALRRALASLPAACSAIVGADQSAGSVG